MKRLSAFFLLALGLFSTCAQAVVGKAQYNGIDVSVAQLMEIVRESAPKTLISKMERFETSGRLYEMKLMDDGQDSGLYFSPIGLNATFSVSDAKDMESILEIVQLYFNAKSLAAAEFNYTFAMEEGIDG